MRRTSFGARLKIIRETRGLSQSDLARKIGGDASAISHFEGGRRKPSFNTLTDLCLALTCSSDYFLGLPTEKDALIEQGYEMAVKALKAALK